MGLGRYAKKATWLLPGLSFKRWVFLGVLGSLMVFLGLALLFNLQPFTLIINVLKDMALFLPNTVTGPVVLVIGVVFAVVGLNRTYGTFKTVMGGADLSLVEELYKSRKLAQGPRIVVVGGGTGLSTMLRGLKLYTSNITAVVTVGDDGGSSGRLRKEQGVIAPGDIRNCIAALADEERLITELFQYRFLAGHGLEGHSFGNLFLTALCHITGDMMSAIKESSSVLNIRGRVLPSTLDNVALSAEMMDGRIVHGESEIPNAGGGIKRLSLTPEAPKPLPEVLKSIEEAELIVLGPGSLYTSVISNLLIPEIATALANSSAPKVYIVNIMTQPGETDHYTVADHIQSILDHSNVGSFVDAVFVNSWLPEILLQRYSEADCVPVFLDTDRLKDMGVTVVQKILVDEDDEKTIRHNPRRLARSLVKWYQQSYRKEQLKKREKPVPKLFEGSSESSETSKTSDAS